MSASRISIFVSLVAAVLGTALAQSAVATVQELPTLLPSSKESTTDSVALSSPRYVLTNGNKVECTTATTGSMDESESPMAGGRFHITFRGCVGEVSGITAKCTGLGDATTGEMLMLGSYRLVFDTGGEELGVALLLLVEAMHFTCAGLFLNVVSGEQVCLFKEPYVVKTLHEVVCEQTAGVQKEKWLNEGGETITPKLSVTEGEAAKPGAAFEAKFLLLALSAAKSNSFVHVMMTQGEEDVKQELPTFLPSSKENSMDLVDILAPKYELTNGDSMKCDATSSGSLVEAGSPEASGQFHFTLKGCVGETAGITAKCTGLGAGTTGEVLMLGLYGFAFDTGGVELGVAILLLVELTHFQCAGLFLNVVSGEQLCLFKKPYVTVTLHEVVCVKAASKGVQGEIWLTSAGSTVAPKLAVLEGEGTAVSAAFESRFLALALGPGKSNTSVRVMMTAGEEEGPRQGLPTVTPTSRENTTDTISTGVVKYVATNSDKLECEASSSGTSVESESPQALGTFHFTYRGCVSETSGVKVKCTGLGDASEGEILILGLYHLVYDTGGTELGVALLLLVAPTHFMCGGVFLQVMQGEQECLIREPYAAKTLREELCKQSGGMQLGTWLSTKGETVVPSLVVVEGESTVLGAAFQATELILWLNARKDNMSVVVAMN